MRADLLPYREATTEQVMAGNLRVTDKEVEHTLGVLEFASNVLVLGKAYFRGMRELQQSAGKRRPGARPRQLVVPMAAAHGMQMWYALIANIAVRSAVIGARRKAFPFHGYSDASFDTEAGWCWHIMGVVNFGPWPSGWKDRIGAHSIYRDIFITELEFIGLVLMVRMIAPRARGMLLRLFCDNIGVVFIVNKLSTRSKRIVPWVAELIWILCAWDVEIHVDHVPTHLNCLADAGTRQGDKDFANLRRSYLKKHPDSWWKKQLSCFPAQPAARPELVHLIPVAGWDDFSSIEVEAGEMGRLLPEYLRLGGAPREQACMNVRADADAFLQAIATGSS